MFFLIFILFYSYYVYVLFWVTKLFGSHLLTGITTLHVDQHCCTREEGHKGCSLELEVDTHLARASGCRNGWRLHDVDLQFAAFLHYSSLGGNASIYCSAAGESGLAGNNLDV